MSEISRVIVNYTDIANALGGQPMMAISGKLAQAPSDKDHAKRLALLKSGIDALRDCELEPGVLSSPEHPVGAALQSFIAKKAAEKGQLEQTRSGGLKVPMDQDDLTSWILHFLESLPSTISPRAFLPLPTAPESVPNDLRVAMLGDWGSGLYGAPACSVSIAKSKYDVLLHLGDVYYVGDESEVREHFLGFWPKIQGAKPMSRALMGNHEAYAGGDGYFDLILKQFEQSSSVFALQNDHFLLAGLDTGYGHSAVWDVLWDKGPHIDWFDPGLTHNQEAWLARMIDAAGARKVVLFTHHQPFSLFETPGPKLLQQLQPLLAARKISAWYWGHEHRAVFYDKHPTWGVFGRCIGHGGFPYFRDSFSHEPIERLKDGQHVFRVKAGGASSPGGRVLDGPNPYVCETGKQFGPHGYAALELAGPQLQEVLYAPDGTELYRSALPL
ncbi:metallophosphoesterase family protein [Sorangium sp. So ce861]|uniref:metallophosphoesterase family protein n=1 Tax=Sorangium sp. So ce861 TaxID=3133323 RepID=UPI003F633237